MSACDSILRNEQLKAASSSQNEKQVKKKKRKFVLPPNTVIPERHMAPKSDSSKNTLPPLPPSLSTIADLYSQRATLSASAPSLIDNSTTSHSLGSTPKTPTKSQLTKHRPKKPPTPPGLPKDLSDCAGELFPPPPPPPLDVDIPPPPFDDDQPFLIDNQNNETFGNNQRFSLQSSKSLTDCNAIEQPQEEWFTPPESHGFLSVKKKSSEKSRKEMEKISHYATLSKKRHKKLESNEKEPPSFMTCMKDIELKKSFTKFLERLVAVENIHFIDQVDDFPFLPEEKLKSAAEGIYYRFIQVESPEEINISGTDRDELKTAIFETPISRVLFENISIEVRKLINDNFYHKWIAEGEWKHIGFIQKQQILPSLTMVLRNIRLRHQFMQYLRKSNEAQYLNLWLDLEDMLLKKKQVDPIEFYREHKAVIHSIPGTFYSTIEPTLNSKDWNAIKDLFADIQKKTANVIEKLQYVNWVMMKTWVWVPISDDDYSLPSTLQLKSID